MNKDKILDVIAFTIVYGLALGTIGFTLYEVFIISPKDLLVFAACIPIGWAFWRVISYGSTRTVRH